MMKERIISKGSIICLIITAALLVITSLLPGIAGAAASLPTKAVREGGDGSAQFAANGGRYSSWKDKDGFTVASKYGFYPMPTAAMKITPFGKQSGEAFEFAVDKGQTISKNSYLGFDARTAAKNAAGWKGTNFRIYNTETGRYDLLDVKVTLADWQAIDNPSYMFLQYTGGVKPSFKMWGILEAEMRIDYFKAGTDVPYTVNSNFTFNDIDCQQYLGFDQKTTRQQYVSSSSRLLYSGDKGTNIFYCPAPGNDTTGTPDLAAGAVYSASSLKLIFGNAHMYDDGRNYTMAHFGFFNSNMAPVEPPEPVKTVSDTDEKEVTSNTLQNSQEKFTYHVKQMVPGGYTEASYFHDFTMYDKLDPCLDIVSVDVRNDAGENISNQFDIDIDGNAVRVSAKDTKRISFYDKMYDLTITARVKDGYDMKKYKDDKGTCAFSNMAQVTINDQPHYTKKVVTNYREPELEIKKVVDHYRWKVGEIVAYKVKVRQTVSDAEATDVVIKDISLPSCLVYVEDTAEVDGPQNYTLAKEGNGWTLKLDKLAYGDTVTVKFGARATEKAAGRKIPNRAAVSSRETGERYADAGITVDKGDKIIVKKTKEGAGKNSKNAAKTKTGDDFNLMLVVALILAGGLTVVMTLAKRGK